MSKTHRFYTNFSNTTEALLLFQLNDNLNFNEGQVQIDFLSEQDELLSRIHLGGELNFDRLSSINFSTKTIRRKYKGLVKALFYSTFSADKIQVSMTEVKTGETITLNVVNQ